MVKLTEPNLFSFERSKILTVEGDERPYHNPITAVRKPIDREGAITAFSMASATLTSAPHSPDFCHGRRVDGMGGANDAVQA